MFQRATQDVRKHLGIFVLVAGKAAAACDQIVVQEPEIGEISVGGVLVGSEGKRKTRVQPGLFADAAIGGFSQFDDRSGLYMRQLPVFPFNDSHTGKDNHHRDQLAPSKWLPEE